METMDIFVPLAYYIGAYRIKSELEDLSLQYLYPDKYKRIEEVKFKRLIINGLDENNKPIAKEINIIKGEQII